MKKGKMPSDFLLFEDLIYCFPYFEMLSGFSSIARIELKRVEK
jgi:hypothetical protein